MRFAIPLSCLKDVHQCRPRNRKAGTNSDNSQNLQGLQQVFFTNRFGYIVFNFHCSQPFLFVGYLISTAGRFDHPIFQIQLVGRAFLQMFASLSRMFHRRRITYPTFMPLRIPFYPFYFFYYFQQVIYLNNFNLQKLTKTNVAMQHKTQQESLNTHQTYRTKYYKSNT